MSRAGCVKPGPHVLRHPGLCFSPSLTLLLKGAHVSFFYFSHLCLLQKQVGKSPSAFHKRENGGRLREVTHQGSQMESATKQGMGLHSLTPKTTALATGSHLFLKKKLSLELRDMACVLDRCHWDWAVGASTLGLPTPIPETIGPQMWISWFSPLIELSRLFVKQNI